MQRNYVPALVPTLLISIILYALTLPHELFAATKPGDIYYDTLTRVSGNTLHITNTSTRNGKTSYTCPLQGGSCKKVSSFPKLPEIDDSRDYTTSPKGTYGVVSEHTSVAGVPTTIYVFYTVTGKTAKEVAELEVRGVEAKSGFSPDESTFVVVMIDGSLTRFDIASGKKTTTTITQTELPFFSISNKGTYLATYDYVAGVHRIWNLNTGALREVTGEPSYVEFSVDEKEAAFIVAKSGFRTLATLDLTKSGSAAKTLTSGVTVEDYTYVDTLYYLANTKSDPYAWSIFARGAKKPIATNASYGDYLKRVGTHLLFPQITEKNTYFVAYDTAKQRAKTLKTASLSRRTDGITRERVVLANQHAALLAPEEETGDEHLIVWLHGGPQRQTSLNYHPYFSYAVYDEMLERMAAAGNFVLKLDYPGSWGYGSTYLNSLDKKMGVAEQTALFAAIAAFEKEHEVDKVYLIGNSYGGYMAFRGLNEKPEIVDGIAPINGVANWYELISDIPSSPFSKLFGGSPTAENYPLYLAASVYTNGKNVKQEPIVVIYGTEDKTVPTKQSTGYYDFMKANGKNVSITALQGEEHVIKKASSLTKMCTAIVDRLDLEGVECKY